MANDRWVPTLGYDLVWLNGAYHVCIRGRKYVRQHIPDDEVTLQPIAVTSDYDNAVSILRALRLQSNVQDEARAARESTKEQTP